MQTFAAKLVLAGSLALGALTFASDGANAMPALDSGVSAAASAATPIEQTGWGCGPYRCWRRPGPYWGRPGWGRPGWGGRRWQRRWW